MKESSLPADNLNRTVDLAEARSRHNLGARRFAVACLVLGLGLVASVVLATGIGRMDVGWGAIAAVVLGKLGFHVEAVDRTTEVVIWGIRLSRVVLSGLVGAALATAGVIFQGLLLNPLADPFTLGVSTGAAFGVALLVMLGVGGSFLGLSPLPLGALAGAIGGHGRGHGPVPGVRPHPQGDPDPGRNRGEHLSRRPHQPHQEPG